MLTKEVTAIRFANLTRRQENTSRDVEVQRTSAAHALGCLRFAVLGLDAALHHLRHHTAGEPPESHPTESTGEINQSKRPEGERTTQTTQA